ncbi:MAG: PAS domain S-box protein [Gammaproteobacteria bacterium]|nr:PAS domain S-box protein [Gammaproteobacteria bacterium]
MDFWRFADERSPGGLTAMLPAYDQHLGWLAGCVLLLATAAWLGRLLVRRLAAASEAVRSSERRNRAIVEGMLDPHLVVDIDGTVSAFNAAAEQTFGWPATDIIGQSGHVLFNWPAGGDRSRWPTRGDRLAMRPPSRRRWVYARGGRRRDGTTFPIEIAISPFEVDGTWHYSCTVRDLSERWEAETKLRRLAAAIEQAGDAIAILDTGYRVQYVNPQYERQSGFTADDVRGRLLGHAADDDATSTGIRSVVDHGRVWTGLVRTKRRDGRMIDEELTVTPVFDADGDITGYVTVMRDVTRRLQAELDRRRLAEALQYCTDSIEILDAQGCIVYVNAAFERSSGQRLGDVRGSRPEALLDFGPSAEAYDDMMRTAYRSGHPWSGTLRSIDTHGVAREEDVTVSPMRDDQGQIQGFVVVKRDTTDRRRLEAQARQRQQLISMGHMADGIAQELVRPVQQLVDSLRKLDGSCGSLHALLAEFDALSRHETPVAPAVIAGCLQSVDAGFQRIEMERALGQANDNAARLAGIVSAMRDVSYASPDMTSVDLNRAIQSTLTVSRNEWCPAADVRVSLDPALPAVRCVAGDISLVVMNLLATAAQAIAATNRSGIRGKGVITVSTQRLRDQAEIRISHTGKGAPPEACAKPFDPAAVAESDAPGIALAHDIVVRRHAGTLALESDGRTGATFIVRLPLEATATPLPGSAAA